MTIKNNIKIKLKQHASENVNNISQNTGNMRIRQSHMTEEQKLKITKLTTEFPNLFIEPNEHLTYTTRVKGEMRTTQIIPFILDAIPIQYISKTW